MCTFDARLRACAAVLVLAPFAAVAAVPTIDYATSAPEGLVGNGRSIVRVRADGFEFLEGGAANGRLRVSVNGHAVDLAAARTSASFTPGGVRYHLEAEAVALDVQHGASATQRYLLAVRTTRAAGRVDVELDSRGTPAVATLGATRLPGTDGYAFFATDSVVRPASWTELERQLALRYAGGLTLSSPNAALNRAVAFNRALIDLGFNGQLHVCDLLRWRAVWSRDLGSGLVPGALAVGDFAAARTTIEHDLARHAMRDPRGLKVTEDSSQGGSAEGVAWLTRAVWMDYRLTGDRAFLARAAATLRPWVRAWLDRDADDRGLIVDTTEWMDHSRFFLFPDGARVLYSNVLFAGLLARFADIERELGDRVAAAGFAAHRARVARAIDAVLWNESAGRYDNLEWWGLKDRRSSSEGNVLAVLEGIATRDRIQRMLAAIRTENWRDAGSTTIFPPMTHVPLSNDHNFHVWPWWNAVEARARFANGDVPGAIALLEHAAATLEDPNTPGQIEELVTPEGVTEGGHSFVTAAGAFQEAIAAGLLGVRSVEAGAVRLRVDPHAPPEWATWSATVPLPEGHVELHHEHGRLTIAVTDPRVRVVEAPAGALAVGAEHASIPADSPAVAVGTTNVAPVPPLRSRRAVTFFEPGVPSPPVDGLPTDRVDARGLAALDPARVGAVVVSGNALPRFGRDGTDVRDALSRYLGAGGSLVFYGATMHDRQTMGERGGVVDWYEYRPRVRHSPIDGWQFRASPDAADVPRELEHGFVDGWHRRGPTDGAAWRAQALPARWDDHPGRPWSAWEWFRARVTVPANARGHPIVLTLGRVNSRDWTYVNGVEVGSRDGAQVFRTYVIRPGDRAYATLKFGGENLVAMQVLYAGEHGGPWADPITLGVVEDESAWTPIDAETGETRERPVRHGVRSWGPGDFFHSWETSRGAFGFAIEGRGLEFDGPLAGIASVDVATAEAFTDFATSKPWRFEPLAWTRTQRHVLWPDEGERYPAAARLVNTVSRGEIVLLPASLTRATNAKELLARLRIAVEFSQ